MILLNYLPDSHDDVGNAIKYGRNSLSSNIVVNAIRSKDFDTRVKKDKNNNINGKDYYVRGKSPDKKGNKKEGI